jgi:hypothetical protein
VIPDREELLRESLFIAEFGILWGVFKTVLNTWMYVRMYGSKLVNLIVGGISPHTEAAESCGFFLFGRTWRENDLKL